MKERILHFGQLLVLSFALVLAGLASATAALFLVIEIRNLVQQIENGDSK